MARIELATCTLATCRTTAVLHSHGDVGGNRTPVSRVATDYLAARSRHQGALYALHRGPRWLEMWTTRAVIAALFSGCSHRLSCLFPRGWGEALWSMRRDSNPRPRAPRARALAKLSYAQMWLPGLDSNQGEGLQRPLC